MTASPGLLLSVFIATLHLSCPAIEAQGGDPVSSTENDAASKASTIWTLELQGDRDQELKLAKELSSCTSPEWASPWARGAIYRLTSLGKPIDLAFTAVDGRHCDIRAMKGKVILIDFWATWCAPCVEGAPKLKELFERFHAQGLEILSVSWDSDKSKVLPFVSSNKLPWPHYFDGTKPGKWGVAFGIGGVPYILLVDKSGCLRYFGAAEESVLRTQIQKLLAE